ncbi:MAG: nucleoside triphosphate pyrophosphohydrolase [Acidobacteria bacterium]|nr:nucleoside triphosphate pyrophosphohydrolase [Acidobacteriota bacterium]
MKEEKIGSDSEEAAARKRPSFEDLVSLMQRLRGPGGCPWDREQTFESLRRFVIEEAYEVVDAIDGGERAELADELGDHLLQVVFLAQLGAEEGTFTIDDAIAAIHDKLVRRHPHVFGDVEAPDADAVLRNWEQMKKDEKKNAGKVFFSGIPSGLPALMKAQRVGEKASRIGFDWSSSEGVVGKIREELSEMEAAMAGDGDPRHELGDLLFAVVNLARRLGFDAENALQDATGRFMRRFEHIERSADASARALESYSLDELEALWTEAKNLER